jgi:hypothetical protein
VRKLWTVNFTLVSELYYVRMSFRYQVRDVTEQFVVKELCYRVQSIELLIGQEHFYVEGIVTLIMRTKRCRYCV